MEWVSLCHLIDHYVYASSFFSNLVGFPLPHFFFLNSGHPEKEMLRLGTNERLGILDPWSKSCEWLTVKNLSPKTL